jgi:serine protease Do
MKRTLLLSSVFIAGALFAYVVSGRTSSTEFAAGTPPIQGRGTALSATGALPDLSAVAERALSVSTNISSTQTTYVQRDPFFDFFNRGRPRAFQSTSLGSGVIVSPDGYILTNGHVLKDPQSDAEIQGIQVSLPDNREVSATLIGLDPLTDLAVIKVNASGLATLPWADSNKVRVAEWVLAVGNPFEFSRTVTLGIISAVNRPGAQFGEYDDYIQTDAAINPGNSGGALVNSRGELVGINTWIYSKTGGYQGLGFAIPAGLAQRIMASLIRDGEIVWGSIGGADEIELGDLQPGYAQQLGAAADKGALVYDIARGASAYRSGLRQYDIITSVNGQAIADATQFRNLVAQLKVGSTATLVVDRQSRRVTISVPVVKAATSRSGG